MKVTFETPTIIGALCEREREVPAELARRFRKLGTRIAFLPFEVEGRHLKNTVACMRLMDVAGLVVCGKHRRRIVRYLSSLDAAARKAGEVDCIVRRGKRFVGVSIAGAIGSQNTVTPRKRTSPKTRKPLGKYKLSRKSSLGLFCQTAVELLTQGHEFPKSMICKD